MRSGLEESEILTTKSHETTLGYSCWLASFRRLRIPLRSATRELVFAPEERDVYSYQRLRKSPAYKHLPRWGRSDRTTRALRSLTRGSLLLTVFSYRRSLRQRMGFPL